eukprot:PhM_4_TR8846/c0_g1_i1/m.56008/K11703/GLT25D; collagen beta-1,O-galactosyltransferase
MLRHTMKWRASDVSSKACGVFDAVYYINLDRRVDRRHHMESEVLPRAKLLQHAQRVAGVDGATLDINEMLRQGEVTQRAADRFHSIPLEEKLYGMDLTPGALGCALSHKRVWQRIVDERRQCALILEDDVEFSPSFPYVMKKRWEAVPADWELVYLGGVDLLSQGKPERPIVAPGVRRAYEGQRELTAYVLNERSARLCLDLCRCLDWQIDTHLCMVVAEDAAAADRYISQPNSYAFHPTLAIQLAKYGTDVQKQPTDNAHFVDATRRMREFVEGKTSLR